MLNELFPPLTGADVTKEKCEARVEAVNKHMRDFPEHYWQVKDAREEARSQLRALRGADKKPSGFNLGWPLWALLAVAVFMALAR